MDSHRFPADGAERDGAAAGGTIVGIPDTGAAIGSFTDRTTSQPLSGAAASFSPAAGSGRANNHGPSGGPRHCRRACLDGDAEDPHPAGRNLFAESEA